MSKVKQYIEQATSERIRSRGLIRKVAIEAARIQSCLLYTSDAADD